MTWQGIPFPLTTEQIASTAHFAVDHLPKIVLDTGDNTWSVAATMVATILGSLIAGAIPAYIAWKTIKKNQEIIESDRKIQQISFDKDREAQLQISERNFNAQVISANRQAWINELRNVVSEYVANVELLMELNLKVGLASNAYTRHSESHKDRGYSEDSAEKSNEYFSGYLNANNEFRNHQREQDLLKNKVLLMLNPNEVISQRIILTMSKIHDFVLYECRNTSPENEEVNKFHVARGYSNLLLEDVKVCLKNEWEKTKTGK